MKTKIVDHRNEIMMFGERVGWRVCYTDGTWETVWLKDDSDKGSK